MMKQKMMAVKNTLEETMDEIRAEREQINDLYPEFALITNSTVKIILFWFQEAMYVLNAIDWIGCKVGSCIRAITQSYLLMVWLLFDGYLICPVGWRTEYVEIVAFGYLLYRFFAQRKAEKADH